MARRRKANRGGLRVPPKARPAPAPPAPAHGNGNANAGGNGQAQGNGRSNGHGNGNENGSNGHGDGAHASEAPPPDPDMARDPDPTPADRVPAPDDPPPEPVVEEPAAAVAEPEQEALPLVEAEPPAPEPPTEPDSEADAEAAPEVEAAGPDAGAAPEVEAAGPSEAAAEPDAYAEAVPDDGPGEGTSEPLTAPPDPEFVAGFGTAVKAGEAPPEPPVRRPRRSDAHLGVDLALRTLVVPDHVDGFWDDMAQRMDDEPQLRLRPRAAVRPITQPPPIVDDHILFDDTSLTGRRKKGNWRRKVVVGAAALLALAAAIGALQGPDDEDDTEAGSTTTTAAPPTTAPAAPGASAPAAPPPVDPAAQLTPNAVGRLPIPATNRDLGASGFVLQIDQATFDGSGGTCYDARIAGVPDLLLRFRSPEPGVGVTDPADGVLASVSIDAGVGSSRTTQAGIGLGTPEDQVRAAYPDGLEDLPHPFVTGGHILRISDLGGTGNGLAFFTDGFRVTGIAAGQYDVIAVPDGCA